MSVAVQGKREELLSSNSKYRKIWSLIQRNDAKLDAVQKARVEFERSFLVKHIEKYFALLATIQEEGGCTLVYLITKL